MLSLLIDCQKGTVEGQLILGSTNPIEVSIGQFYGIEINDFAVTVAKTALWIAESQMMKETETVVHMNLNFLPLKTNAHIVEGNALRLDWESIVPKAELNYIMGNPPFSGARIMKTDKKDDLNLVFGKIRNVGNMDYVCCWYKKAADLMLNSNIRTALVSTNSISQGEQVANLWKPLFENGVHIDFAHRTFRWDSEAKIKAHVHCVIIGFSVAPYNKNKIIFSSERPQIVKNINAYLVDAPNILIKSRKFPICNVPVMDFGNMPNDGKGLLSNYETDKKDEIIKNYPLASKMFKEFLGANEFINNKKRWCIWLKDISPSDIRKVPPILEAVLKVKEVRESSSRAATKRLANVPYLFGKIRQPDEDYILIPRHSSENRKYIPIGYVNRDIICGDSNMMLPCSTFYYFGILTSNVHMAWMRMVCGRLEMRYRYSKDIVYNNFPWPTPTEEQKAKIEKTAQAILDARALYPDSSLADLYDEVTMPPELRKAHQNNDRAVMEAYGFTKKTEDSKRTWLTESECVAELMKMYQKLTENK